MPVLHDVRLDTDYIDPDHIQENFIDLDERVVDLEEGGATAPTGTGFVHVTAGTQDAAAKLVENADVAADAAIAESKLNLASDAAAATPSRRTLGTGATQALPGNHASTTNERVPVDNSATDAKIGNRTIADTAAPSGDTGTLTTLLGWLASMVKAITGKANWRTPPDYNLTEAAKVEVARNGSLVSTRRRLNLIPGSNTSIAVVDDAANGRANVTITASAVGTGGGTVTSVNGIEPVGGDVTLDADNLGTYDSAEIDALLADKAPLDSPVLTGTPTAPHPAADDDSQQLATTGWVQDEITGLGGGAGDMEKAVYDTDDDGKVNSAEDADALGGQNSAYHLSRANHTGTQAQSTIVNLVTDLAAKAALTVANSWTALQTFSAGIHAGMTTSTDVRLTNLYIHRRNDINHILMLDFQDEFANLTLEPGRTCTLSPSPNSGTAALMFQDDSANVVYNSGTSPFPIVKEIDCMSNPILANASAAYRVALTFRTAPPAGTTVQVEVMDSGSAVYTTVYGPTAPTIVDNVVLLPQFTVGGTNNIGKIKFTFDGTNPLSANFRIQRMMLYHPTAKWNPWHVGRRGAQTLWGSFKVALNGSAVAALFVDEVNNRVGINTAASSSTLHVNGQTRLESYTDLAEIAAPATPGSNLVRLYAKDKSGVSELFYKNDAGTERDLSAAVGSVTAREVDAAPSVAATVIEFPNGTLTDQGGGVARYTPTAAGGGDRVATLVSSEVSVSGAVTLDATAFGKMHVLSGSSYTVTLPAVSGNTGKIIGIRAANGLTGAVTIDGNGSETINGALATVLLHDEAITLLCDGTAWAIVDRVTRFSGAKAHSSGVGITVNNTTLTDLAFPSESYDSDGYHDNVTNNSRHTAKRTGKHYIEGRVRWPSNATGQRFLHIFLNNTTYIALVNHPPANGDITTMQINTLAHLAANDYVTLRVYQTSGSALSLDVSSEWTTCFSIEWRGE